MAWVRLRRAVTARLWPCCGTAKEIIIAFVDLSHTPERSFGGRSFVASLDVHLEIVLATDGHQIRPSLNENTATTLGACSVGNGDGDGVFYCRWSRNRCRPGNFCYGSNSMETST